MDVALQERQKQSVGRYAARYVEDGMRVGLGTGSTVRWTILALAERGLHLMCVATSVETQKLALENGLEVLTPGEVGSLDIAIDGADEVDPAFNLIKGGGGALAREKIVASMTDHFVVVVDESKSCPHLGAFPLPVEVLEFGADVVAARLRDLGAEDVIRRPVVSDNGNPILDAGFGRIDDPCRLAVTLEAIPGIVEHGIFPGSMVRRVVAARGDDVVELSRSQET